MVPISKIFSPFAILSIVLIILLVSPPVRVAEISSKIDLDDDEATTPPTTLTSSVLKAFVDINQGDVDVVPGLSRSTIVKQPPRGFRQPAEARPTAGNSHVISGQGEGNSDYINIEELFKSQKSQQIRQNNFGVEGFYRESDVRPTIINNIHVTINANETSTDVNGCKNGLCDVRVTSKPDGEGNVITNVHLSVVTKLKKSTPVHVADIPVIEGTAGLRDPPYDQIPAFHFVDQNVRHGGGPLLDNNIPQIPIHRQDVDSWYHHHPPVIFQRPRPVWQYGRNLRAERGFAESRSSRREFDGWTDARSGGIIVNDKIEPPLSKIHNEPNVGGGGD